MDQRLSNVLAVVAGLAVVAVILVVLVFLITGFQSLVERFGSIFYSVTIGGGSLLLVVAYVLASEATAAAGAILLSVGVLGFLTTEIL